MAIIATAGSTKTYSPAPAGTHQAVCVDVIDKGMQPNPFKPGTQQRKVDIVWQIAERRDDEKRFLLFKRYTLSLNEKASLRHDLESWRGRAFTEQELKGFDVETVKGANCLVNVQHRSSQDGTRTYANVVSVMPLVKGMPKMVAEDYQRQQDETPVQQAPDEAPSDEPMVDLDSIPF